MSNPDASAGPYVANEKKPIGGNIIAHASTTRCVSYNWFYVVRKMLTFAPQNPIEEGTR